MSETLEIPVTYKNKELLFKASVVRFGYVHRVIVDIDGTHVNIERDEEGNYRALVDAEVSDKSRLDQGLVEAIIDVLQAL